MTPKSYLSFINGYKNIYAEKVKYINEQAERMNIGKWNRILSFRACLIGIPIFCLVDIVVFENKILIFLLVIYYFEGYPYGSFDLSRNSGQTKI